MQCHCPNFNPNYLTNYKSNPNYQIITNDQNGPGNATIKRKSQFANWLSHKNGFLLGHLMAPPSINSCRPPVRRVLFFAPLCKGSAGCAAVVRRNCHSQRRFNIWKNKELFCEKKALTARLF